MTNDNPLTGSNAAELLEALIPKSLDDIVRKNRDIVQIGLATSQELAARTGNIEPGHPRDRIDDWRIIAFRRLDAKRHADDDGSHLSLLGRAAGERCPWITSYILKIDIDGGFVQTQNSLYRLGARGEGEPPLDDLLLVCAHVHRWDLGRLIGAPEIFY